MRRYAALLAPLLAFALLAGEGTARAGSRRKRRPDNSPKVGDTAPDFDLVRLDAFLAKTKGKTPAQIDALKWEAKDRIKLSSFRGKRPVVLVLTSYT